MIIRKIRYFVLGIFVIQVLSAHGNPNQEDSFREEVRNRLMRKLCEDRTEMRRTLTECERRIREEEYPEDKKLFLQMCAFTLEASEQCD